MDHETGPCRKARQCAIAGTRKLGRTQFDKKPRRGEMTILFFSSKLGSMWHVPKECDSTTCLAGFQCYLVGSNTSSRFQRVYSLESLYLRHLPPYYIQQNEFLEVGSHKSRVYCGLLNSTNSSKHCDGATLVVPRSTVITRTYRWLAVQITVTRESSYVEALVFFYGADEDRLTTWLVLRISDTQHIQ